MLKKLLGTDQEMTRESIAEFILRKEARFDQAGRLIVYPLPKGDGGGTFEVAGINDRYHPKMASKLAHYINSGRHETARKEAVDYLVDYTAKVAAWHADIRVEAFLRDCCFNRGAGGAAAILQHSLTVAKVYGGAQDRIVGPMTRAAAAELAAEDLLPRLLLSRQWYERYVAKRSEKSVFWSGLSNRWVDVFQFALGIGNPLTFGK